MENADVFSAEGTVLREPGAQPREYRPPLSTQPQRGGPNGEKFRQPNHACHSDTAYREERVVGALGPGALITTKQPKNTFQTANEHQ
jgi:hypothetical protein